VKLEFETHIDILGEALIHISRATRQKSEGLEGTLRMRFFLRASLEHQLTRIFVVDGGRWGLQL
jgi:hypothetical protein